MPVTFRGGLPIREDDGLGSGSCSHSVNSYGILEMLLSGQELRPAVEIGSKHTYKRTQLLINAVTVHMDFKFSDYPTYQDFGGWCYCEDMDPLHLRGAVEGEIRQAFHGVTLGKGMSLRQAQYAERFQDAVWNAHSTSLGKGEITNDWSQVSLGELERDHIALLDAFGFRYYIPALMLSVLDHYDASSMRIIGTLSGLYPKKDGLDHSMYQYSLLNPAQKAAIAHFLEALPRLVDLDAEDQKIVDRALRNYWGEYLQRKATE